jgi:V/A-type H+-transporting ATPase subunit A
LKRQLPLFKLVDRIFTTKFSFDSHDEARQFFLALQNKIKNMNFMPFDSDQYKLTFAEVESSIEKATKK